MTCTWNSGLLIAGTRAYDTQETRKTVATCILCGAVSAEISWPLVKGQAMETKHPASLVNLEKFNCACGPLVVSLWAISWYIESEQNECLFKGNNKICEFVILNASELALTMCMSS